MGFFNENSLGEVTGVCTTVLGTIVFTVMILVFEWRVGLIVAAGIFVYFLVVSSMERKSAAIAPNVQKSQTALTSAVLINSLILKEIIACFGKKCYDEQ